MANYEFNLIPKNVGRVQSDYRVINTDLPVPDSLPLLEELKNNTVSCKDVNFQVFGLSLASINVIFSLVLSVIFLKLFLNYGKN